MGVTGSRSWGCLETVAPSRWRSCCGSSLGSSKASSAKSLRWATALTTQALTVWPGAGSVALTRPLGMTLSTNAAAPVDEHRGEAGGQVAGRVQLAAAVAEFFHQDRLADLGSRRAAGRLGAVARTVHSLTVRPSQASSRWSRSALWRPSLNRTVRWAAWPSRLVRRPPDGPELISSSAVETLMNFRTLFGSRCSCERRPATSCSAASPRFAQRRYLSATCVAAAGSRAWCAAGRRPRGLC